MHSMTEEIVSGHVQALPRPLPLGSVSRLQPAVAEDGMETQLETKKRSDNCMNPASPLPKEAHQGKEDSFHLLSLREKVSGCRMLSEKLICPDASMPGHLEEVERRQAGVEEPQVAKEASLADSQRPVESAKTPDVSLFTNSHRPPQLERVDVEGHQADGQMYGTEDSSTLQLPVLQPEEVPVLRGAEADEESVPPVTNMQKADENINTVVASPDQCCPSDAVKCVEEKNGATYSSGKLSAVPDMFRKTPVVLLTRLSADLLDSRKWPLQVSATKTDDSQCRQLAVRVDQGNQDRAGPESVNDNQSKKTKNCKNRSKLQERLSPLNQMLEQSNVWSSKFSEANTVSTDSPSANVQLDENSNNEPEKSSYTVNSSVAGNSRDDSVPKTLQSACSNRKGADGLKKKRTVVSDPSLMHRNSADEIAVEKRKTSVQDPPLLQPYTHVSNSNHSAEQSPRYATRKIHKHLHFSARPSKDSYSVPTPYTAYSPGALKMTFISCNKSSMRGGNKSRCELETDSDRSSPKEPALNGWENCPDVIFDCSSQERSVLLNATDSVSRNPKVLEHNKEQNKDDHVSLRNSSADLGVASHLRPDNFLPKAKSQPPHSCPDQDPTFTSAGHTKLSAVGDEGDASVSLPQPENTAAPTHAAHGNAAESTSSFVPSSSQSCCQSAIQGSGSSRDTDTLVPSQWKESDDTESAASTLDNQSPELAPSDSENRKNGLSRPSPARAALTGTQVKLVKRELLSNMQTKRLQRSALPSKSTATASSGPASPRLRENGKNQPQNSRLKSQGTDTVQPTADSGLPDPASPMSVVTVHVSGGNAAHGPGEECVITCIEKTSPPFIIPHQEGKMVESDMVVMQNYYYSTLQSTPEVTQTGVSGCCQKSDVGVATSESTSAQSSDSPPQSSVASEPDRHPALTLMKDGENFELAKHEQCFSNQSYLVNAGILMVNTSATVTHCVKTSPGRKRAEFRSVSEDSDTTKNAEYKDILLSSVIVDEKCFHTSVDVPGIEIPLTGLSEPGAGGGVQERGCNALKALPEEQTQQGDCHCENMDVGEECESTPQQQNGSVDGTLLSERPPVGEEMLVTIDEDMLLQNFEGEIMGQVQIRQDNEEFDEVFDIVNERDVPIPHEAFLHSLSLIRNTGRGTGAREPPQPANKTAMDSPSFGFLHEGMEENEKDGDDSDATLPYPRDEKRERSKAATKPRRQKRSRRRKRKPARTTKTTVSQTAKPVKNTEVEAGPKNLRELPVTTRGAQRGEERQQRKKSTTRHPLFKQRHQAVSRRAKDKAKSFVSKSTAQSSPAPPKVAKRTSPAPPPAAKKSAPVSSLSSKSSESDSGSFSPLGSLPKELAAPSKAAQTVPASGASLLTKSSLARTISNRGTIAINSVPAKSSAKPARLVSRPQRSRRGTKRRWKPDRAPEASATEEKTGGIFEGTRLTDESDTDELPTIVPPKRRRQQTSQRSRKTTLGSAEKAASAAAAVEVKRAMQDSWADSQGTERIMREFPRHNWLEHKILQKNTYTPPGGGLSAPMTMDGTDPKELSSPKASKRSESCDALVMDRTQPAESHSLCSPRPLNYTTGVSTCDAAAVMEKNQGQAPVPSSQNPSGGVYSWTSLTTADTPAGFSSILAPGSSPVTSHVVSDQAPLVTSVSHQFAAPSTHVPPAATLGAVCTPNFLHVDQGIPSSVQPLEDRLSMGSGRSESARGIGQDAGRLGGGDAAESGHTAGAGRQAPMTCTPRMVSGPCAQPVFAPALSQQGNRMTRPILVPVSFPVQSIRIPVIPFMPSATRVTGIPHMTQLSKVPVVTSVSCGTTASRQVMPIQPQVPAKRFALLPATSGPGHVQAAVPSSTRNAPPSSEVLTSEVSRAASSELNPYEDTVNSPPDLSPGRLHIDIGDVSPSREERVTPTLTSALPEERASHERGKADVSSASAHTDLHMGLTDTPSAQDAQQESSLLSVETQDVNNAKSAPPDSSSAVASSAPAQATASSMFRSKSSGSLSARGWKEKTASEKDGGRKTADSSTYSGRRKSWEQTHKDLSEDEVEVTLIELTSSPISRAAAAVSGSLPASTATSSISTPSSESSTSSSTSAYDRPIPPLLQTPLPHLQPLSQSPHHPQRPQGDPSPPKPPSLPPPPSLICTSSSAQDREGEMGVLPESWRREKEEVVLCPGNSEASVPLDLCTQKSDILGGSRVRTNPPVQLVLPQVQHKSDVMATTTTTTTSAAVAASTASAPSPSPMISSSDVIASTKLVLKVISESLANVSGQHLSGGTGVEKRNDAFRVENSGGKTEAASGRWRELPAGKASVSRDSLPLQFPQSGERAVTSGAAFSQRDAEVSVGGSQSTEAPLALAGGSAGTSSQDPPVQLPEAEPAQQESRMTSSQSSRDPDLSSPQSSDSTEEERLRSQLRELEQMAARKMQEREQLLMLHKRKAEMLTEMESKRRRTSASATCTSTAPDLMETSSSADTTETSDSSSGSAGTRGSQDRSHSSDRALSEQLMALQRVLISALSSLPQAAKEDGASSQPQSVAPASVAADASAGPSTGVLDLSSSGRKETGPSADERRPLVQMINQAIHLMTHKQNEQLEISEGKTTESEADKPQEVDGSIRPAHQALKDASCPPANTTVSPSPFPLNSPYTRRQMPLDEPPVPGHKHSQVEAPKSAHSQPPFQPAGSLIVPAISPASEPSDKTGAGSTSQSQEPVRAGSERQEEKRNERGQNVVENKSSGVPHNRSVIDLTRDSEDSGRSPEIREKYGAKGNRDGDGLMPMDVAPPMIRASRCGDIAAAAASAKVSQPLPEAPSDRSKVSVPVKDFAPEVSGPMRPCPEEMPRSGLFPPNPPQDPAFQARLQQQVANASNKRIAAMEKGNMMIQGRPSGEPNFLQYPQYREKQSGQHDLRRSSENCPPQMGVSRMPVVAAVPQETHALEVRPPPHPAGHPGGVRFPPPMVPAHNQTVVLRNPMDDTHLARQSSRMAAGIPKPPEYLSKSIPQPQPQKRHPGQTSASHTFQQQQGAAALQIQQQHPPYLSSRQHLQQHVQQHIQHQQQQQPLPVAHHVPHGGLPAPTTHAMASQPSLSSTRPPGFSHVPRIPYSGVQPPAMTLSHLGVQGSVVPHSGIPHSEAHPSKVPHSKAAYATHFSMGGSVPLGVPVSHASSYYSQGMGVRGELPPSGQQLQPARPSPGQHMRPQDMEHVVRSSQAGVRPPYFPAPGPPQPMESSKRVRLGGGAPFPSTSQPYPLPPHHPLPHNPNHPSPTQRVEVEGMAPTSAQQASRPSVAHPGGQPLPSPPARRKKGMCELCGALAMYLCSLCRSVWYCSQQCQSAHWRTHSTVCKQPKS